MVVSSSIRLYLTCLWLDTFSFLDSCKLDSCLVKMQTISFNHRLLITAKVTIIFCMTKKLYRWRNCWNVAAWISVATTGCVHASAHEGELLQPTATMTKFISSFECYPNEWEKLWNDKQGRLKTVFMRIDKKTSNKHLLLVSSFFF